MKKEVTNFLKETILFNYNTTIIQKQTLEKMFAINEVILMISNDDYLISFRLSWVFIPIYTKLQRIFCKIDYTDEFMHWHKDDSPIYEI